MLKRNFVFRADKLGKTRTKEHAKGTLLVLRHPGEKTRREMYEAFVVPTGTSYREIRMNLSSYAVNPATISRCTGVYTEKKQEVCENDIVRFGTMFDPFLVVFDEEHLTFALKSRRMTIPLCACMGEEIGILGDLFHDGDYLYESPLMDPYLYLKDEAAGRIEHVLYGTRNGVPFAEVREADSRVLNLGMAAGEGRKGWVEGTLLVLRGKTKSGKIAERLFIVPAACARADFEEGRVLPVEIFPDSLSKATPWHDAAGEQIFEGDSLVHAAGNIAFTLAFGDTPAGYLLRGSEGDLPATPASLRQMYIANDALAAQEEKKKNLSSKKPAKQPAIPFTSKKEGKAGEEKAKVQPAVKEKPGAAKQAPKPLKGAVDPALAGLRVQCQKCGRITSYGDGTCPSCGASLDTRRRNFRDPVEWTPQYQQAMEKAKDQIDKAFLQRFPDGKLEGRIPYWERIKQQELLKLGVYWKTTGEMNPESGRQ